MPSVMIEKMITAAGLLTFPTGPQPWITGADDAIDGGGIDAGGSDGGGSDGGGSDGGGSDGGGSDAGGSDAGGSDAGGSDAGGSDAGGSDGGKESVMTSLPSLGDQPPRSLAQCSRVRWFLRLARAKMAA
jgi:hypothetical protein